MQLRCPLSNRFVYAPVPVNVFPSLSGGSTKFEGTSAASAIIAGMACQLQSLYIDKYRTYLKPDALRSLLCNSHATSVFLESGSTAGFIPNVVDIAMSL
ncbi:S8 family serine peptidase [Spirosoma sp. HMF3257]|uniref:Peptidase S8/S53 domain-containing protein n=2 Tax=Spirosoma telluris TaxID=2183553 RepID=A0A327NSG3_9BACT|nr:S8 family serine peptidase [Spirosoma telluris]RAI76754.1 hypothetical protein HMF3257_25965 [Spirosoma telluris]